MSKKQIVSAQWVGGKNRIKCKLHLIIFNDDDNCITYCPALDLSGYGATEEDAKESFETTLSEYFRYTVNKKTLAQDLKKLGWVIRKNLKKRPVPPTLDNLLRTNEDFSRIFNTYDFNKRSTTVSIPELV